MHDRDGGVGYGEGCVTPRKKKDIMGEERKSHGRYSFQAGRQCIPKGGASWAKLLTYAGLPALLLWDYVSNTCFLRVYLTNASFTSALRQSGYVFL